MDSEAERAPDEMTARGASPGRRRGARRNPSGVGGVLAPQTVPPRLIGELITAAPGDIALARLWLSSRDVFARRNLWTAAELLALLEEIAAGHVQVDGLTAEDARALQSDWLLSVLAPDVTAREALVGLGPITPPALLSSAGRRRLKRRIASAQTLAAEVAAGIGERIDVLQSGADPDPLRLQMPVLEHPFLAAVLFPRPVDRVISGIGLSLAEASALASHVRNLLDLATLDGDELAAEIGLPGDALASARSHALAMLVDPVIRMTEQDPIFFERVVAGLGISAKLVGNLASAGVNSFAAAHRQRLNFADLTELPSEVASKLMAHTRLVAVSADFDRNTRLVAAGVQGVLDLARQDAGALARTLGEDPAVLRGLLRRARLYRTLARARLAEAVIASAPANRNTALYPFEVSTEAAPMPSLLPMAAPGACDLCNACESALSPAAYLVDLIDFLQDSFPATFPDVIALETRFYRPFGSLVLNCGAVEDRLKQIEIANEVLERFVLGRNMWQTRRGGNGTWLAFAGGGGAVGARDGFTDVAAAFVGADLHLCAITSDGHLWHAIFRSDGSKTPFIDVELMAGERGTFTRVACAGWQMPLGELHVCAITSDGRLWHTIRQGNGTWLPFVDVETRIGERGTFASVACASVSPGDLHVCGATREGKLWHTVRRPDGSWATVTDVEAVAGEKGAFVSAVCSVGYADALHICGITTDGRLWHTVRSGSSSWTPFTDVEARAGERGTFTRVVSWLMPYGDLQLCALTADGRLWYTLRSSSGNWAAFVDIEGQAGERGTWTSVACAMYPAGDLYVCGTTVARTRDQLYAEFAVTSAGYPRPDALAQTYETYLNELWTSRAEIAAAFRAAYRTTPPPDRTLLTDLLRRLGLTEAELTSALGMTPTELGNLDRQAPTIRQVDRLPDFVRLVKTHGIDQSDPRQIAAYHDALARAAGAITRVQGYTLPNLRANLIYAALRVDTFFRNARELGNHLHIDLSVDGSATTTRVANAIEALQSFVLAYQLGRDGVSLGIPRIDFDTRWRWLQSYGLWQAAQTVFLYPENFLLPRVRRAITPQFRALLERLEEDSSPASAVAAAEAYAAAVPWGRPIGSCRVGQRLVVYGVSPRGGSPVLGAFADDGEWLGWTSLEALIPDFRKEMGSAQFLGMTEWNRLVYVFYGVTDQTKVETTLKFIIFSLTSLGFVVQGGVVIASQTIPRQFLFDGYVTKGIGFIQISGGPQSGSLRIYVCPATDLTVYVLRPDGDLQPAGGAIAMGSPMSDVVGAVGAKHYLLFGTPDTKYLVAEFDPSSNAAPKRYDIGSFTLPPGSPLIQGRSVKGAIQGGVVYILATLTSQFDWGAYGGPTATNVNKLTTFTPTASGGTVGTPVDVAVQGPYFGAESLQACRDRLYIFYGNQDYELSPTTQSGWVSDGPLWLSWFPEGQSSTVGQSRMARPESADGGPDYYQRYRQEQAATFQGIPTYRPKDPAYVYLEEYYHFIPLVAASYLSQNRYFREADAWLRLLYNPLDQGLSGSGPIVYRNLNVGGSSGYEFRDSLAWLRDPFNPYLIARTRQGAFLRQAIYQYVENLLDWADAEFARDSAEAINRARELYELAEEVLQSEYIPHDVCGTAWRDLIAEVRATHDAEQARILELVLAPVATLDGQVTLADLQALGGIIRRDVEFDTRLVEVKQYVDQLMEGSSSQQQTLGDLLTRQAAYYARELQAEDASERLLAWADGGPEALTTFTLGVDGASTAVLAEVMLAESLLPRIGAGFCVPPNLQLNVLRWRTESNLDKIRTGCNFAGMRRQVRTYAAPVDALSAVQAAVAGDEIEDLVPGEPPPIYRFSYLIERARYYVSVAQQLEGLLLASFEKGDEAAYSLLKARQDLKATDAHLALQALRLTEATDGVELARRQRDRAGFQQDHFAALLSKDLNHYEQEALKYLQWAQNLQFVAAGAQAALALGYVAAALIPGGFGPKEALLKAAELGIAATQTTAGAFSSVSQWNSMQATFERRREEWRFQRDLAQMDYDIGVQGVTLAVDRVNITQQEQQIAQLQKDFAIQVIDFLSTKFTNKELYDWMARMLRRYYRDHLNFATVTARMAQRALAFERQEPIAIVAPYYAEREKRDLLAAEQLLTDVNKLDQHRLATEKRRKELTKLISLASVAPVELQHLRNQGWLECTTPLSWFDRDFPGHYLRLIKSVSLTIVGLIPPGEAIHATLANDGLSRAIVGPPFDETRLIQRLPEAISVTTASNGTGLFELRLDDPILLPFEGSGVETTWRLELPKGANRFDFDTLVDVLLTIRYTALEDQAYRQKVLKERMHADKDGWVSLEGKTFFSARYRFPDAWYQFQNPVFLPASIDGGPIQPTRPYSLPFELRTADFPPNEEVRSGMPRVIIVAAGDAPGRMPLELSFMPAGATSTYRAIGDLVDGQLILSHTASLPLNTLAPLGTWTVRVRNEESPSAYPEVIGSATGGGRATWDRVGKSARLNVALAVNGATATASSIHDLDNSPSAVINGERRPVSSPTYWADNTPGVYPDWIEVRFAGTKTIDEIDVVTTQDAPLEGTGQWVEPTETLTFAKYGITAFEVQYWVGAAWVTVPGGNVTGNNKIWRKFTFPPVPTDRVRVLVNNAVGGLSRIVELEAYESGTHLNVARATNGGQAQASSILQQYPPSLAINGDRLGRGWVGQTPFTFPGWLQIDLNGMRTIDEVDVFSHQDPPVVPPTETLTFMRYGLTDFEVQYWDGTAWVTVPGGSISGNNKVWRKVTFPPVTTDKVRVLIHGTSDGQARLIELEAYGYGTAETIWLDDALPAGATPAGGTAWTWVSAGPAPGSGMRALQSAVAPGIQEYSFSGATAPLVVNPRDVFFAHVYLDPRNPPSEIMLQWYDGSWEHRAYWGADNIARGTDGTASRRRIGPLPTVGRWVRLEVPAVQVGLENRTVTGMALLVYGERQLDLSWLTDILLVLQYQARTRYVL
jgi:Tc toxin complex TcA C-terminal TcB-binding domain/F5/8 type C domain